MKIYLLYNLSRDCSLLDCGVRQIGRDDSKIGPYEILLGNDNPYTLRDNTDLRNNIAGKFEDIKNTLDTMITEMPSRKFAFDE